MTNMLVIIPSVMINVKICIIWKKCGISMWWFMQDIFSLSRRQENMWGIKLSSRNFSSKNCRNDISITLLFERELWYPRWIGWPGFRKPQKVCNSWSNSIVLENMVFIHFGFRNGAKNQVIWTTRYRVTAISQFSSERAKWKSLQMRPVV